jgi:hypothetical protein
MAGVVVTGDKIIAGIRELMKIWREGIVTGVNNTGNNLMPVTETSNGNASETKANESFDNGVFFDIEAKRTPSIVITLFSKRSEQIR